MCTACVPGIFVVHSWSVSCGIDVVLSKLSTKCSCLLSGDELKSRKQMQSTWCKTLQLIDKSHRSICSLFLKCFCTNRHHIAHPRTTDWGTFDVIVAVRIIWHSFKLKGTILRQAKTKNQVSLATTHFKTWRCFQVGQIYHFSHE
jgi:hypothetical protein